MSDIFTTNRLTARRWQATDLNALLAVYGDADAMRWVGDGTALTQDECLHWLEVTRGNYQRYGYGMFALDARQSGALIGFCGLVHPGGQLEAEVKYALLREFWGQGFASEAVPALLTYGAVQHGLQRITATVAPDHLASQRVLLKAGMVLSHLRENDNGSTTHVYAWHSSDTGAI